MFIMLKDKVMDHSMLQLRVLLYLFINIYKSTSINFFLELVKQHMVDQEEIKQLITSMQVLETTARSLNKTLKIKVTRYFSMYFCIGLIIVLFLFAVFLSFTREGILKN